MFIFYFSNLSPAVPLNSKTKITSIGGKSGAAARCLFYDLFDLFLQRIREKQTVNDQYNAEDHAEKPKKTANIVILRKRHTERQNNGCNGIHRFHQMDSIDLFCKILRHFRALALGKCMGLRTGNIRNFCGKARIDLSFFLADKIESKHGNGKKNEKYGKKHDITAFLIGVDQLSVMP